MRVLILAVALLATSSLSPSIAQETDKPPIAAPQTAPVQPDPDAQRQQGQRTERDQPRDRAMDRDGRMRRGDDQRMGEVREMEHPDRRMHRDWEEYGNGDKAGGRYGDRAIRDNRGYDRADQGRGYGEAYEEDRPRRRVKICVEYENGDEYCRYRQERSFSSSYR